MKKRRLVGDYANNDTILYSVFMGRKKSQYTILHTSICLENKLNISNVVYIFLILNVWFSTPPYKTHTSNHSPLNLGIISNRKLCIESCEMLT